jgi:Surface antigen variable number repeat/Gram-negative bacterial TonB protein C-terminal
MTVMLSTFFRTVLVLTITSGCVSAQIRDVKKCSGPIHEGKELTRRAKIIEAPDMDFFAGIARQYNFQGEIRAEAVLCRSGQVTDIHIITTLPENLAEFATAAISTMRFTPAEVNWHTVSQRMSFEFSINQQGVSGITEIDLAKAKGRLVEELDFIGYRRINKEQILGWVKTRPGDVYAPEQVQKDLKSILATGYFNARGTQVALEDGVRGGVRVIFEVFELPLIVDLKFDGLKEPDVWAIVEELRSRHVDVRKGAPLDPGKLNQAERVIERFFEAKGWREVKAQALIENVSATEVAVTFKITGYKFGS